MSRGGMAFTLDANGNIAIVATMSENIENVLIDYPDAIILPADHTMWLTAAGWHVEPIEEYG